jgi:FkbM family methyltransferase
MEKARPSVPLGPMRATLPGKPNMDILSAKRRPSRNARQLAVVFTPMSMSSSHDVARLLGMSRLTHVVDIGANPIDGAPPYRPLLDVQLCRITGFEPQAAALAELNLKKGANETYLPYAIGDGEEHTLNLCAYSGWTSTLVPSAAALEVFSFFKNNARVVARTPIQTQRLDDLAEVDDIDFLKIDIQGGELAVLVHGREKLRNAVVIQTELQFVDLYEGQPSFGQVDQELPMPSPRSRSGRFRRCSSGEIRPSRSISCSRLIWFMSATSFMPTACRAISSSSSA